MMRPARAAIAGLLVGVLLGASGCGRPAPGTDGNLVDDWRPLAAPGSKAQGSDAQGSSAQGSDAPSVGTCLDSQTKVPFDPVFLRATPIECERGHTLEVVLVGTVDGDAAQASEPPAAGSEAFQAAYAACGTAAGDYVGGEWHTGMLGINMQMPNRLTWADGLRSYVCSIFASRSAFGVMAFTSGSLKGSMTGAAPRAIHCLDVTGTKASDDWWDRISALTPIDCAQPHEAEFVGTVQMSAGGTMPAEDVLSDWTTARCGTVAAAFMGITDAQFDTRADVGIYWDGMSKAHWDSGDRHQRCFALFYPGDKARASIKGLGRKALPVRSADAPGDDPGAPG